MESKSAFRPFVLLEQVIHRHYILYPSAIFVLY